MPTISAQQVLCDGCPSNDAPQHLLAGIATYRDGGQGYIALCIDCRIEVRNNAADNISHFEVNR